MQKIFGIDKCNFYVSDITTSIIYNDETIKNKIVLDMYKENFLVIDSKLADVNITVKEYLNSFKFDMKLIPYYNLKEIISKKVNSLRFEDQIFIKIISLIGNKTEKVVFDDVLTFLSSNQKLLILKFLKDNNITYFNFTSDMEEVLYTKYLIALSSDGVIIEGTTKSVLKEEKIIKHNGFNLPFIVDLSHQLMDYGILDKEYYSVEKLVSDLWK